MARFLVIVHRKDGRNQTSEHRIVEAYAPEELKEKLDTLIQHQSDEFDGYQVQQVLPLRASFPNYALRTD